MDKKSSVSFAVAWFVMATCQAGLAVAAHDHYPSPITVIATETGRLYTNIETRESACRRYTVTWSGGVATRGPDRVRARPVRARWQSDELPTRCESRSVPGKRRVSEQSWIR